MTEKEHKESRSLPVMLTDSEVLRFSSALAKESLDLAETDAEKKEVAADFKAKATRHEATIGELSRKISTRREYRDVECIWEFYWDEGKKILCRTDTGEEIDSRPITEYERQMWLKGPMDEAGEDYKEGGDGIEPESPSEDVSDDSYTDTGTEPEEDHTRELDDSPEEPEGDGEDSSLDLPADDDEEGSGE